MIADVKVHGPTAVGLCQACHTMVDAEAHRFKLTKEQPDLCYQCHGDPPDANYLHGPVRKAQEAGDKQKAQGLFEKSLTQFPTLVESRCALGFSKLEAGDWGGTASQFEFALAEQPSSSDAQLGRAAVLARTVSGSDPAADVPDPTDMPCVLWPTRARRYLSRCRRRNSLVLLASFECRSRCR